MKKKLILFAIIIAVVVVIITVYNLLPWWVSVAIAITAVVAGYGGWILKTMYDKYVVTEKPNQYYK